MKRVEIWSNGRRVSSSKNLAGIRRFAGFRNVLTKGIRVRLQPKGSPCDALLDVRFEGFNGTVYTADSIEWASRAVLCGWLNRWRNVAGVSVEVVDSSGNVYPTLAGKIPFLPGELER